MKARLAILVAVSALTAAAPALAHHFGDTIVVDGYLARDGSHTMDARRVTLADGRVVSGASAGDGGPGAETQAPAR